MAERDPLRHAQPETPGSDTEPLLSGFMTEINVPMINYKHFYSTDAENQFRSVDYSQIEAEPGVPLLTLIQPILAEFNTRDYDSLLSSPSEQMKQLRGYVRRVIGKSVVKDTFGFWPPTVAYAEDVNNCLLFVVGLTHLCGSPETLVRWASEMIVPEDWHDRDSFKGDETRAICLCHRKRKVRKEKRYFWAELDKYGEFTLWLSENGQISNHFSCHLCGAKVSKDGMTVTVLDRKGHKLKRFEPIDLWQGQLWASLDGDDVTKGTPAAMFLATTIERPLLPSFLPAVYFAVTANDMFVLRTLLHHSVTKMVDAMEMCEALLDIFMHAGKMTQLLLCMAGTEFDSKSLTPQTILRSNSILTTMMKLFILKFGGRYTENVLVRLANYIIERGDLKLGDPANAPEEQVRTLTATVLKTILRSGAEIGPEIRHLASIVRSCATSRFNNKQATYCALSGFFNLRYICPFFTNPKTYTTEIGTEDNILKETLVPFSGLLLHLCNLCPMSGRFEPFATWNPKLSSLYFPDLVNFVLSIGDIDEQPEYEAPSDGQLREALLRVVAQINKSHDAFVRVYNEIADSSDHAAVVKWNISAFINSYFTDNITDSRI